MVKNVFITNAPKEYFLRGNPKKIKARDTHKELQDTQMRTVGQPKIIINSKEAKHWQILLKYA